MNDVTKPDVVSVAIPGKGGILSLAINAGAGYLVGNLLGYPIAGAVATGAFGILGLLGVAIYSAHKR